jgi:transcriptional regulator of acetoin/glycerol metabolism
MTGGDAISAHDLPDHITRPKGLFSASLPGDLTLKQVRQNLERDYIVWHLKKTAWNISKTAGLLGIERTNLHKKITQYKITRDE